MTGSRDLQFAVHPRLRGELTKACTPMGVWNGSSPLARGTQFQVNELHQAGRFIPACAGNSENFLFGKFIASVHPRLRGELTQTTLSILHRSGSSPLARGTPRWALRFMPNTRFIPACAGNSIKTQLGIAVAPVHPRLRGELT